MDKRKSKGVIFFVCLGILLVVSDFVAVVLKFIKPDILKIIIGIIGLFLSFSLLRLKNWARISMLILTSFVGLILLVLDVFVVFNFSLKSLARTAQDMYSAPLNIVAVIFLILFHVYNWGFPIFFTRPKVKEQFSAKKIGGSALGGKKEQK